MKITYAGPFDAVEVDILAGRVVTRGETIDVADDVAGRPPAARYLEVLAELAEVAADHAARVALLDEFAGLDAGTGLLAQHDSWRPATEPKPAKPGKDGAR